ncbi:MAG TPA: alkaline phosphatase family protein [Kofleriaceae bacterium]
MRRVVLVLLCVAACGPSSSGGSSVGPARHEHVAGETAEGPAPRLVVLLVIDQWPEWAFEAKRPALTAGGFSRLLSEGDWHVGQHPTGATLTAPGHALLGTGEPPYHSGILANEWWHRDTERSTKSVEESSTVVSALWLRVPGLGDSIAAAKSGAKAVSIALKDRAAILPLGHAGTAVFFDSKALAFSSLGPLPWLADYNRAHPVEPRAKEPWVPMDSAKLASLAGVPDDRPGEVGGYGYGRTFPHVPPTSKLGVEGTPLGNDLVLETALAAIDGEHLGADDSPDLLIVSLSTHDFVGHAWGQESWEMWDMTLRLDASLAKFFAALDAKVGAGKWAMIATSDHGAAPLPEAVHGGRVTFEEVADAANRAAATELGTGSWIASGRYPTVYLSKAALALKDADRQAAIRKIMLALRSFPGIDRVERAADFEGNCEQRAADARRICMMLDPERSGEIVYFPAKNWILVEADDPAATAHGSLHAYDRDVPLLLLPPGRKPHAPRSAPEAEPVDMTRVAAILAGWLHVKPPTALPRPEPPPPPPPRRLRLGCTVGTGRALLSGMAVEPPEPPKKPDLEVPEPSPEPELPEQHPHVPEEPDPADPPAPEEPELPTTD